MADLNKLNDEGLMGLLAAGETGAFEVLFERYKSPLMNFLYRYTADDMKSEDLFQQVFIKVYQNADNFKGDSRFKTWLYSIAVNSALDLIRKEKKERGNISMNGIGEEGATIEPPSRIEDPSDEVSADELREYMERALADLAEEYRAPFILARFQQMSYQEISQTLGITLASVRMRVHRANKQLTQRLERFTRTEEAKHE